MYKVQKTIIGILSIISIAIISSTNSYAAEKLNIYVQDGCSHCAVVEAFITRNNLNDKVTLQNIRTSSTAETGINDLFAKYNQAGQGGTPAAEADGQLLAGDRPIIDWLKMTYNVVEDDSVTYASSNTTATKTDTQPLTGSDIAFLGIGGVVLVLIVGYGIFSAVKKN